MEVIIKDVSYSYDKEKEVLKEINLTINGGLIYGITGKSGSGKSTLLELINGAYIPTKGSILVDNILLTRKYRDFLNNKIGLVSQFTDDLFLEKAVIEDIRYSLNDINKIIKSLNMVGLNETYLNRSIDTLSSGEKRLIAIATQLVKTPSLLILDEPGLGLDRVNKLNLINLLKNINKKYKVTIIIVSHDINFLNMIVDHIIILEEGKILTQGKKEEVFKKITLLKKHEIELPKILEFTNMVQKEKNVKLGTYDDVKDLIKAVYRNVR